MIQTYKCEYCGEIFENKDTCFKHEIEEHEGKEEYYNIIYETLDELNNKYDMSKNINNRNISININSCECDGFEYIEIHVSFLLDNDLIIVDGVENSIIYDIKKQMEECFLNSVKNIEGTLTHEGWCGGYGADDYIINGTYLKDFLKNKEGKYIKIEIFD